MEFVFQTSVEDNGDYLMIFRDKDYKYYYFECNLFTTTCKKITFEKETEFTFHGDMANEFNNCFEEIDSLWDEYNSL
jgi:hypothetical protein